MDDFWPHVYDDPDLRDKQLRAKMILKDIYARNPTINPDMPIDDQIKRLMLNARLGGMAPEGSGWASPEQRAQARAEYAAKGKTDREKQQRWEDSIYLMDPDTYKYMQGPGRDIEFLNAIQEWRDRIGDHAQSPPASTGPDGINAEYAYTDSLIPNALDYWDKSNNSPLYRQSFMSPNYQGQANWPSAVQNVTTNPDLPSGNYMNFSEVIPDWIRLWGSGESPASDEAMEGAMAKRYALNRYRINSPSPVLDFPADANPTAREKANRIRELRGLTKVADVPEADQRWARWTEQKFGTSFVPAGWLTDTLDFGTSFFDPTAAIPVGQTAGGAARIATKGAKVAGTGWVKPLLSGLVKTRGTDFGADFGVEMAAGHGLGGSLGGKPGRSWDQWLLGSRGTPVQKTEQEVRESRDARRQLYDQLKDDDRVSRADEEAYKGLRLYVP